MRGVLRYLLVGAVCQVINSGGFAGLHYALHWNALLAQGVTFVASTLTNYFLSRKYVFGAQHKASAPEVLQFFILAGIALLATVLALYGMTDLLHMDAWLADRAVRLWGEKAPPASFFLMVPQLLTGSVAFIVQYVGGKLWVFRGPKGNRA